MTAPVSYSPRSDMLRLLAMVAVLAAPLAAQTRITPPNNKYSVAQDVELGREAAAQARTEMPLLNDDRVDDYVERVGARLVAAIPPEFRHGEFRYSFDVINLREINAFALPGGPMFLNRGMMEAASSEAEMAGVMAHEISHVALRHGTAQATRGERLQIGAIAGQVLGAIVGGTAGSIIAQGSQFGLSTYFLKFGREYETQADLLGAQMLARAGYDPRQMANMFKTIESQGGGGGPEFLSSHPNPGNRFNAINREADLLTVTGTAPATGEFQTIKARLGSMSPALTAQQVAQGRGGTAPAGTNRAAVRVEPPASEYRTHQPTQFLRVSVPANWRARGAGADGVTYAPDGGVFQSNGATAFTHGVQFGVAPGGSRNLQRDTDQLLQGFAQSNPRLRRNGNFQSTNVGGRNGLTAQLGNVSDVTGQQEYVNVATTYLRDGRLFFMIGVAPQTEANRYAEAFARVRQNLRLAD